jgi:DNA-binding NtrC family response regulator
VRRFGPAAVSTVPAYGGVRALEDIEAEVIRFAIAHYRGQMSEVARRLGIGRSTLYRRLDALAIPAEDFPALKSVGRMTLSQNCNTL